MSREGRLVAELRQILGEEALLRLAQELGGLQIYIPYKLADDNEIVLAIGREAATRLSAALAPDRINVPLLRRERVLAYHAGRRSARAIARLVGLTERRVRAILSDADDGLSQRENRASNGSQLRLI